MTAPLESMWAIPDLTQVFSDYWVKKWMQRFTKGVYNLSQVVIIDLASEFCLIWHTSSFDLYIAIFNFYTEVFKNSEWHGFFHKPSNDLCCTTTCCALLFPSDKITIEFSSHICGLIIRWSLMSFKNSYIWPTRKLLVIFLPQKILWLDKGKIFEIHISDKRLIFRIYKELM